MAVLRVSYLDSEKGHDSPTHAIESYRCAELVVVDRARDEFIDEKGADRVIAMSCMSR